MPSTTNHLAYAGTLDGPLRIDGDLQVDGDLSGTANVLALRNGTNAQEFQLTRTSTDDSNYERLSLRATATDFQIDTQAAGTGGAQHLVIGTQGVKSLYFKTTNINRWLVNTGGQFLPAADVTYDIGGVGTDRVRDFYLGRNQFSDGYLSLKEIAAPGVAGADRVRLYAKDNGSGKTQLMAIFQSGAEIQLAIEA